MADINEEVIEKVEEDEEIAEETPVKEVEEEVDWKAKAEEEAQARAKSDELANNQKIRAEKAEKKLKEVPQKTAETVPALSSKDVIYMAKADIHEDDVDEVLETARVKGWDVKKAHEYLKPILEVNAEKRSTANAANVNNVRRGPTKVTGDTLLQNAQSGKLPDSDADIAALMKAAQQAQRG